MENKNLDAQLRTLTGKNVNRRLREDGFIPAVLYSHGESKNIQIKQKDFFKTFHGHVSESVILDLNIEGNSELAFIKDYQRNPISGDVIHVDFFKVTKGEKITTNVPIEITGSPVGVKMGGNLEISEREIEIECLPKDLPETITVDVTDLNIGDTIHASDVEMVESMKLITHPDVVIAAVQATRQTADDEDSEAIDAEATTDEEASE